MKKGLLSFDRQDVLLFLNRYIVSLLVLKFEKRRTIGRCMLLIGMDSGMAILHEMACGSFGTECRQGLKKGMARIL